MGVMRVYRQGREACVARDHVWGCCGEHWHDESTAEICEIRGTAVLHAH